MSTQNKLKPKRLIAMLLTTVILLGMLPMSAVSASAATGSGTSVNDPFIVNNYYELYSVLSSNGLNRKAQYIKIGTDFNTQSMNGYSGLVGDNEITINAKKYLDLNGKKVELISKIKFFCPINIYGDNAVLTIDDSVGGGELSYKTAGEGRSLIDVWQGELVVNGGTLTSKMHSSMNYSYFGVIFVQEEGSVTVNGGKILYQPLYDNEYSDNKNPPIIWESGITLPYGGGKVTVNGGEMTRLVAKFNPCKDGDKNPNIIINGGVFHRSLGFYVDELDYNVSPTLPVQINGGEFRFDSTISGSYAAPFTLYASGYFSKVPLSNFPGGDGTDTQKEYVLNYLKDVHKNLFSKSSAVLVGNAGYKCTAETFDGIEKITAGSCNNGTFHIWLKTGSETVRISKLPDIKAEYNGAELIDGNIDDRYITDLGKCRKVKITWDAPSAALTGCGYELKMQCMLLLPGTNYTINNIIGMPNGDGTLSSEITLPSIDENTDYEMFIFAGLWKSGADDAATGSGKLYYLVTKGNDKTSVSNVQLKQGGGDITPDVYYGKPGTNSTIYAPDEAKYKVYSQTNWSGNFNGHYFIAGEYYTKTVVLQANTGYRFFSKCDVNINAQSTDITSVSLSADKTKLTLTLKAKCVTVIKEAYGYVKGFYQGKSVSDVYIESADPDKYSIEIAYIGQKINSTDMIEPNPDYFVKGTPYIFGVKIVPKKGYGFLETVWGNVTLNIPMDQSYARDDETATIYKTHAQVGSVSYDGKFFETEPDNNGCYAPMEIIEKGYTVSGSATSFGGNADEVTVQLIEKGTSEPAYETIVKGNNVSYSISNVAVGTYTIRVIKKNHAAREYSVKVENGNVTQNVKICLLGDVNMDGNISVLDVTELQNGIAGFIKLNEYQNKLSDVNNDGNVSINDATQIQNYIAGYISEF